jgi:hypothetical protein
MTIYRVSRLFIVMPIVGMLDVVMLDIVMLGVVMLGVVMLNFMGPTNVVQPRLCSIKLFILVISAVE